MVGAMLKGLDEQLPPPPPAPSNDNLMKKKGGDPLEGLVGDLLKALKTDEGKEVFNRLAAAEELERSGK